MNINLYNNNWLNESSSFDVSNNILYTSSNRFQKTFMKDFLDVSGSIIIRNGFIYNDHLSNYLTYHDNYLLSLSGLFLNKNNSINSYIATSNINYNLLKPYLILEDLWLLKLNQIPLLPIIVHMNNQFLRLPQLLARWPFT